MSNELQTETRNPTPETQNSERKQKPRAEIRQITPQWAREILAKHDQSLVAGTFRQRGTNQKIVALYAADMKAGNWSLTGQGISFDTQGNLLDGQHRLAAIVKANLTIPMLVMWDLPKDVNPKLKTIDTFDIGKRRNLGQQLQIEGFTYYTQIGAVARALVMLASGNRKLQISPPQGITIANLFRNNILHTIKLLEANAARCRFLKAYIIAPIVMLGTVEPDTADLFTTELNERSGLSKTSPVLHLHRFLERPTKATYGTDYQILAMKAFASALYSYANEKRVEHIRGNDEHLEWLLKTCKNTVNKIREIAGIELTMAELKEKIKEARSAAFMPPHHDQPKSPQTTNT